MRRILGAVALVALLAAAGCGGPQPRFVRAVPMDKSIEKFDFGNARWQTDAGPLTLHDGHRKLDTVDPQTADISAGPYFADVNGDRAEDAAIELHVGGQGFTQAWYIWLWRGHTARQITDPFIDHDRCGGSVDSVTPVGGGFRVQEKLFSPQSSCAEGGTVPVTYTVGMRAGFVVQTEPILGPVPICNTAYFTLPVTLTGPVTPRAAASDRAPAIAHDRRYRTVMTWQGGFEQPVKGWVEVLLDDGKQPPYCGYVPLSAVAQ